MTNDPMEATYIGIHMWAQAVEKAKSTDTDKVIAAMAGQTFKAPGGFMSKMDEKNHHPHKPVFIGEIKADGQFNVDERIEAPNQAVAAGADGLAPFVQALLDDAVKVAGEQGVRGAGRQVDAATGATPVYACRPRPKTSSTPRAARCRSCARPAATARLTWTLRRAAVAELLGQSLDDAAALARQGAGRRERRVAEGIAGACAPPSSWPRPTRQAPRRHRRARQAVARARWRACCRSVLPLNSPDAETDAEVRAAPPPRSMR